MMYNESFPDALPAVKAIAPPNHTVTTGTSTLCKLVSWWQQNVNADGTIAPQALEGKGGLEQGPGGPGRKSSRQRLSQWQGGGQQRQWCCATKRTGSWRSCWGGVGRGAPAVHQPADHNNALKLGYDPGAEEYPLAGVPGVRPLLPPVVAPGTPLGAVGGGLGERWGIPAACQVVAGTTDSIAAFLAAQVARPGEAVTSLRVDAGSEASEYDKSG